MNADRDQIHSGCESSVKNGAGLVRASVPGLFNLSYPVLPELTGELKTKRLRVNREPGNSRAREGGKLRLLQDENGTTVTSMFGADMLIIGRSEERER